MINDSRKPNCKVVVEQKEEIKLAFYTIKDIKKSQELRFDYNDKTAPWRKVGI
jgi:SET domain-containing protein